VVVDDHRDRDGRIEPADVRVRPRFAIKTRVFLEVLDLLTGRFADIAALLHERERLGRDLVGIYLVAEQHQRVRPALGIVLEHLLGQRVERVELAPIRVVGLRQRVGPMMRERDPA
jgi:hypothetical protein